MLNKQKMQEIVIGLNITFSRMYWTCSADFGDTPESQMNHNTNRAYPTL